jgi:hypothetical protein
MAKPRILSPVQYVQHKDSACSDCGKLGCLTPVPHKVNA